MDEVAAICAKEHLALSGTNQFEMVFRGSPADVKIPRSQIALFRDRQVWPGPDGKPRRIYVMADGSVQSIQADDNFQAWEREHILTR